MVKGFSHYWTKRQIREQLAVIQGKVAPTMVIQGAQYLNSMRKCFVSGNIWIHHDRIVYVGENMPTNLDNTEIVDASGKYVVPGYIEHHAHPFQLYNPLSLAEFAAERGTTTLVCDNMPFMFHLEREKAFHLLEELQSMPTTFLWWARYDGQTELKNNSDVFSYSNMRAWIDHPYVVQGGELTDWPSVLQGDDQMLHWMLETKDARKPIEGHLPGAGETTLAQMALLGVEADHESMTANDVLMRLDNGIMSSLRYSSIRPDLPKLLRDLHAAGLKSYDELMMTTDGSPPEFMSQGMMDHLISLAVEEGVPFIDAVHMCTYNVAKYLYLDDVLGMIAPGRLASLNILSSENDPKPESVLAKGKWVVRDQDSMYPDISTFDWSRFGFEPFNLDFELTRKDFKFSMPVGLEMENEVIMKPYQISRDLTCEELPLDCDEHFMMLLDRNGKWSVETLLKGFATSIHGFASSFSNTGDILLIGKSKQGLLDAFKELNRQNGGIVVMNRDDVAASIPLPIGGGLSDASFPSLVEQENHMKHTLEERGYKFSGPIYSLLFFSATHLPYVRLTQKGIFDVKKKKVLFPSIMR
ncbi:adenine deaminase [Paenalkalicoccus suaedae]|uniref:adenine deaminase n=1 Tax=Paenalkalicoccus suaedae TaxID=2592382 RepID=A0A859FDW9_9BACI|nr:adenine deaminase C-terminal domain-containing protein [Paenalkalicoccus suaedae]QKS70435.1 adenine deaminase [Paenalkalicoccus suaedae]